MELSSQDALRLHVMLASKPQAIRIHESSMTVYALSAKGEAQVKLHPNCRDEQYIKRVKELLSGHVLGSPGGYPVYLQRWTRMGQMRDDSLEQLLLLGEPEAVVAAVCAVGLDDELARRAWWAMEDAENARQMLKRRAVIEGSMGAVLAAYLVEHLPFEAEPDKQIETVRLVLQQGLLDAPQRLELWRRAQRKPPYYIGFLASLPDALPEMAAPAPELALHGEDLRALFHAGNAIAGLLLRVFSASGQAYVQTLLRVLKKPANQEVVNSLLDTAADYFAAARPCGRADATLEALCVDAATWAATAPDAVALLEQLPQLRAQVQAVRVFSGMGYGVVRPVFRDTTAIGSLMRRKLEPVFTPLMAELACLNAVAGA